MDLCEPDRHRHNRRSWDDWICFFVYLASAYGTANLDLVNVTISGPEPEPGYHIEVAEDKVVFNVVGLTIIGAALDGVSVTSHNGAVEADISLADIEENPVDLACCSTPKTTCVDLTLTDSIVLDAASMGCNPGRADVHTLYSAMLWLTERSMACSP